MRRSTCGAHGRSRHIDHRTALRIGALQERFECGELVEQVGRATQRDGGAPRVHRRWLKGQPEFARLADLHRRCPRPDRGAQRLDQFDSPGEGITHRVSGFHVGPGAGHQHELYWLTRDDIDDDAIDCNDAEASVGTNVGGKRLTFLVDNAGTSVSIENELTEMTKSSLERQVMVSGFNYKIDLLKAAGGVR